MASTKSFEISKQVVWEAYQRVKANKGAAGVDDETLGQFEQHLKRNLYKKIGVKSIYNNIYYHQWIHR